MPAIDIPGSTRYSSPQVPRTETTHATRRSMSVEPYTSPQKLPVLWAQQRYFANRHSDSSQKKARLKPIPLALGSSQYAPYSHGEHGQPTAEWMQVTPPKNWPEKKRPASRQFTRTSTSEWQGLHRGEKEPVENLTLLRSTKKDREQRLSEEQEEEAAVVRRLNTPEGGRREQLLEEVLRQLQGDGPMERLQSALISLDEKRVGIVSADGFREVLQDNSKLELKHINFLMQQAGTEETEGQGEGAGQVVVMVQYNAFLDMLRVARNRKMAALQRASRIKRRGLKRWQFWHLARVMNAWRAFVHQRKGSPPPGSPLPLGARAVQYPIA